jgi:hypothetical protein
MRYLLHALNAENTSNTSNKKNFLSVLKSPTQIGFEGVINLEPYISCLGPFNIFLKFYFFGLATFFLSGIFFPRNCISF